MHYSRPPCFFPFSSNVRPLFFPLLSSKRLRRLYFCKSLSRGQQSEMPAFATVSHRPPPPRSASPQLAVRLLVLFHTFTSSSPFSLIGDLIWLWRRCVTALITSVRTSHWSPVNHTAWARPWWTLLHVGVVWRSVGGAPPRVRLYTLRQTDN